jgi:hypothetical protein
MNSIKLLRAQYRAALTQIGKHWGYAVENYVEALEAEVAAKDEKIAAADALIKTVGYGCTRDTDFCIALEAYEKAGK